ncbi:MAG: Gfo/Idh/MocA family oxidoreductase [Candidatus Hydrogenedentes bacterium]|nr:Gfo/Idh/MocA family oxidoreductase [Candidatus Hydrogenedentota bacterium]
MDRRTFLRTTTAAGIASTLHPLAAGAVEKAPASERLQVCVMGAGGRAMGLLKTFSESPYADVVAIADIDSRRIPEAVSEVEQRQGSKPWTTGDFRKIIDDPTIDALVIGTPDHWHAIPTILACMAGKDVYVEKPDGHNMVEGQRMVAAMRKHSRIVQMGSQHRATERLQSAIEYVRSGALGRCLVAKAWESTRQGSIGHIPDEAPPEGVDYDMWLGGAPKRPFNPRRFHGNWRWFYDYGTGDLGNDGVHRLDMAVALLNAACEAQGDESLGMPRKITASGGKWYFDDMQEFPDTLQVNYEYEGAFPKLLTYEMRIWSPYPMNGLGEGAAVYGDNGYIEIGNNGWRAFEGREQIKLVEGDSHERPHVQDFIDCVKSRNRPYCDLETVGHPASVLCHAGNISARLGRQLTLDAASETFIDDNEANALRTRPEYRAPWLLPEV